MKLITEVHIPNIAPKIGFDATLLFAGSCFADNIGAKFTENKFNACVNPYGVLYNPLSVLQLLKHASEVEKPSTNHLIFRNDLWHSFAHHGSFSTAEKADLEENIIQQKNKLNTHFNKTDYLFITWGTAWVYRFLETNKIVANCHKLPAKAFERFRLSTNEIVEKYSAWITETQATHPNLKIILTVSPVRHLKDTAHGNQLSKSVLLLAAEQLCSTFNHVSYFPSYEIVLDELRDYRFYAEDLTHPNHVAISYIWEKITENCLDEDALRTMPLITSLIKAAAHRPLNVHTPEHQKFVQTAIRKIEALTRKKQALNFTVELETLRKQLL